MSNKENVLITPDFKSKMSKLKKSELINMLERSGSTISELKRIIHKDNTMIRIGSVVTLKSGGEKMTALKFNDDGGVVCGYWSRPDDRPMFLLGTSSSQPTLTRDVINIDCLKVYSDNKE